MSHLRKRFSMALVPLLITAVALTSVSYAWFTITTNPEVTNIVTSVGANQNLEIALDDGYRTQTDVDLASMSAEGVQGSTAGDPYTWGNLVDLTMAFQTSLPQLRPVTLLLEPEVQFQYATYGADGRVQALSTLQPTAVSSYENKGTSGGVEFYSPNGDANDGYAYSVTYWMRSNMAGDVTLCESAKRANDGTDATTGVHGVVGAGSYISIPLAGNGTAEEMDRFVSKLRVVFLDVSEDLPTVIFEASICAGYSDGVERKYDLVTLPTAAGADAVYISDKPANPIALTANQGRKVQMLLYLDGESVTNAEALLYDTDGVKINVQFDHSAIKDDTPGGGAMTGDTDPAAGGGTGGSN